MINSRRIVPVGKSDLLSIYGTALAIANVSATLKASNDVEGNFTITGSGSAGTFLCSEPAKSIDFADGVTGATVYFIPTVDGTTFAKAGTASAISGTVLADGSTLHKAVLSSGTITVTKVTPVEA